VDFLATRREKRDREEERERERERGGEGGGGGSETITEEFRSHDRTTKKGPTTRKGGAPPAAVMTVTISQFSV